MLQTSSLAFLLIFSCSFHFWHSQSPNYFKLSILVLCAPVFIFTSGSWALLGRPCCGLSIWLLLLAIFNTLFWVYAKKVSRENEQNGRRWFGAQSINAESLFLCGQATWPLAAKGAFNARRISLIKILRNIMFLGRTTCTFTIYGLYNFFLLPINCDVDIILRVGFALWIII